MAYEVTIRKNTRRVEVKALGAGRFAVILDDARHVLIDARFPEPGVLNLIADGVAFDLDVRATDHGQEVTHYGTSYDVVVLDERKKALLALAGGGAAGGDELISTSMPGKVVSLLVELGEVVDEGQGIVVIEAMKMENELKASRVGVVKEIAVAVGEAVQGGAKLVVLSPLEEGT